MSTLQCGMDRDEIVVECNARSLSQRIVAAEKYYRAANGRFDTVLATKISLVNIA